MVWKEGAGADWDIDAIDDLASLDDFVSEALPVRNVTPRSFPSAFETVAAREARTGRTNPEVVITSMATPAAIGAATSPHSQVRTESADSLAVFDCEEATPRTVAADEPHPTRPGPEPAVAARDDEHHVESVAPPLVHRRPLRLIAGVGVTVLAGTLAGGSLRNALDPGDVPAIASAPWRLAGAEPEASFVPAIASSATDPSSAAVVAPSTAERAVSSPAAPTAGVVREGTAAGSQTIYSAATPDVDPPQPLDLQISPPLLPGPGPQSLNTVELVIAEHGGVLSVMLTSAPTDMPEVLLLNSAKSWRFRPAQKDGRPVRYRLVYHW